MDNDAPEVIPPEPEVPAKPKRQKVVVHPNATKSLRVLDKEWQGCIRCELGVQRDAALGTVVTGGGKLGGILFVGESPGVYEERTGHPYSDNGGGRLLHKCMQHYNIKTSFATYVVACRSCSPVLDDQGFHKRYPSRNGEPGGLIFQAQPPTMPQMDACAPRLFEEIYIVDPVIIVAMGATAASYLAGTSVNVKKLRGSPLEIGIPGAGTTAVFSEKKHEWKRKVKGVEIAPTKQNVVRYMMVPTYDVYTAYDHRHDTSQGNIYKDFTKDILMAKMLYDRYHEEVSGITPESYELDVPDIILAEMEKEDANDG